MMRDSPEQVLHEIVPGIKTGKTWNAMQKVKTAENVFHIQEIFSTVEPGKAGLGSQEGKRWHSKASVNDKRHLVVIEISKGEEERKLTETVSSTAGPVD